MYEGEVEGGPGESLGWKITIWPNPTEADFWRFEGKMSSYTNATETVESVLSVLLWMHHKISGPEAFTKVGQKN